jgi:hypothetical protein
MATLKGSSDTHTLKPQVDEFRDGTVVPLSQESLIMSAGRSG